MPDPHWETSDAGARGHCHSVKPWKDALMALALKPFSQIKSRSNEQGHDPRAVSLLLQWQWGEGESVPSRPQGTGERPLCLSTSTACPPLKVRPHPQHRRMLNLATYSGTHPRPPLRTFHPVATQPTKATRHRTHSFVSHLRQKNVLRGLDRMRADATTRSSQPFCHL
jgi:hypothetical protein